ncbi:hypothetical protein WJX72_010026 [[Myrmecia] bisecta]|uniref:Plastid lipid-associated protein/fibrillin conserved domain-containing protein n=1 Tax=[Myrmecia] bisecta TaxID=41462 RepID=A0AAW1R9A4_9CHLO
MAPRAALSAPSDTQRAQRKKQLLEAIQPLARGVQASQEDKARIEALARAAEQANPTPKPLASDLINGQWRLVFTTSQSILGTSRPWFLRPSGPIYQVIDAVNLKALNRETWPFFNQVQARLTAESGSKVKVQFTQFRIFGLLPVSAPPSARGELDTTYLDEEMRISRGDRGNLFVLLMDDRSVRP